MSNSTYNLILLNSSILPNSLERGAFCNIVLKLRVLTHFPQNATAYPISALTSNIETS